MRKVFLLAAMCGVFAFSNANAQKKDPAMNGPKFGIGAEFAIPLGELADDMSVGFGGSFSYIHPVASNVNLTLNAGFINFQSKQTIFGRLNGGYIPVKAGARFFLNENFYVNGEIGAVFGATDYASGTAFVYSPGVGIQLPVSNKSSIDIGGRYEGWANNGTSSFIGIRAAFNFNL